MPYISLLLVYVLPYALVCLVVSELTTSSTLEQNLKQLGPFTEECVPALLVCGEVSLLEFIIP